MSPSLPELIQRFITEEIPAFAEARSAWAMCDATTFRFIRYCEARGVEGLKPYTFEAHTNTPVGTDQVNPAPELYVTEDANGNTLMNEGECRMCGWHCIVDAGECLIDFTARQYQTAEHRMEFPLIIPMNRAMAAHA